MNYCIDHVKYQKSQMQKNSYLHIRERFQAFGIYWKPFEVTIGSTLTGVATGWKISQITAAWDAKCWYNKRHYFINPQYFMLLICLEWWDCYPNFGHMWHFLKISHEILLYFMIVDIHQTVNTTTIWKSCWGQFWL